MSKLRVEDRIRMGKDSDPNEILRWECRRNGLTEHEWDQLRRDLNLPPSPYRKTHFVIAPYGSDEVDTPYEKDQREERSQFLDENTNGQPTHQ